jgi:hypothetical protein
MFRVLISPEDLYIYQAKGMINVRVRWTRNNFKNLFKCVVLKTNSKV